MKRTATKASLQHPYEDQILTPTTLYQFVLQHIKGMYFAYATLHKHEEEAKVLADRLNIVEMFLEQDHFIALFLNHYLLLKSRHFPLVPLQGLKK